MKAGMNQNSTMKWFLTTVASTGKFEDRFSQLINDPNWDCDNVDLVVKLNNIEFEDVGGVFNRLHDHFEKQKAEIEMLNEQLSIFNQIKEIVREEIEKETE